MYVLTFKAIITTVIPAKTLSPWIYFWMEQCRQLNRRWRSRCKQKSVQKRTDYVFKPFALTISLVQKHRLDTIILFTPLFIQNRGMEVGVHHPSPLNLISKSCE